MDKGIQKVEPSSPALVSAPSHIKRGSEREGTDRLAQFVVPPLLKIVQKQSDDQLLDTFGKGCTIITPANVIVAQVTEPFYIVPLIQYPEYITWAPIELKGQVPPILDRSIKPDSIVGRKATNKDTWFERDYVFRPTANQADDKIIGNSNKSPDDDWGKPVRHVEHITFLVMVVGGDFGNVPCVMSFARGSHRFGRNFASLLQMRNADVFGCVFEVRVPDEPQKNEKGTWYIWQVSNPSEDAPFGPWVDNEEDFEVYRQLSVQMEEAYQNDILRPDYAAAEESTAEAVREDL